MNSNQDQRVSAKEPNVSVPDKKCHCECVKIKKRRQTLQYAHYQLCLTFWTEIWKADVFITSGGFLRDTWIASLLFVATPLLVLKLLNEAAS